MLSFSLRSRLWVLAACATALTGCATTPAGTAGSAPGAAGASSAAASATPAAAGASAPRGAGAAPAATTPGQPPAFATVIKDAKRIEGLIAAWQKEDKFWLELAPEDFGRPLLLAPKIAQGIGEASLFGGTVVGPYGRFGKQQLVEFRRVHNQVQLIARNTEYVAAAGTPEARAVDAGFSPSLVASTAVASQAHPERKSVLVEANALFVGDLLGLGTTLQRAYRQGYGFDGRNSALTAVRSKPDQVVIEVLAHYATGSIAQPQPGVPGPGPAPTVPATLPDARSLFLGLQYSLAKLPEQPMRARLSDPRVGYFETVRHDFGDDLARTPRVRYANRWRLEKKDPAAARSEPVKPITYWLDRTIPLKYRDAVTRGILAWNAAFERIGFKDAIVVKVQPDDADFDTLDVGVASVRWMTNASPTFAAIGPIQTDPRSGEILDADIGLDSLAFRGVRTFRSQVFTSQAADWAALMQSFGERRAAERAAHHAASAGIEPDACRHAEFAAEQMGYALEVLDARGELDPAGPEAQAWVLDYLTEVTMHEVGHTLGLLHNFRSSRIYSDEQLSDPEFTRKNGLAGSVMDYAPINLTRPGERATHAFQLTLGPYDYWAVEYGYKPLAPEQEREELLRIAARSHEPELAYGSDEDNLLGVDPESLIFDLGNDPVAFAKKRFDIARDVIRRQEGRELRASDDYSVLRRSVTFALRDAARAAGILARQIGGVRTLRDFPGSGRDPLVPVSATLQREALDLLARGVLASDAFVVSPALRRRLAPSFQDRRDALYAGELANVATDYSLATVVLDMQRALLGALINDGVAQRLLDGEGRGDGPTLRLSELYQRLADEVWSELKPGGGDIVANRRELQREYANRLTGLLLRPSPTARADARSLVRVQAQDLLGRIQAALPRKGLSAEARAHLADSADSLKQALSAPLLRAGG